jgi:hypothetical protein
MGVAKVARMARVPATTLYSFCQNTDRELAFGTAIAVGRVLENLQASDRRDFAVRAGIQPKAVKGIPVVQQSASHKIFYHPVGLAAARTLRWFDEAWLLSLGRETLHHYSIVNVTESGLSPVLQAGDQALVHSPAAPMKRKRPGIFLVVGDDRLSFVRCERTGMRKPEAQYVYRESSEQGAPAFEILPSQIVGEVVWIGRTLTENGKVPEPTSPATTRSKETSKKHGGRGQSRSQSRPVKSR